MVDWPGRDYTVPIVGRPTLSPEGVALLTQPAGHVDAVCAGSNGGVALRSEADMDEYGAFATHTIFRNLRPLFLF